MQFNPHDIIEDDRDFKQQIEDEQSFSLSPRDRRLQYRARDLTEDKMSFEEWEKSDLCIY
jgi:hypothetical protein